MKIWPYNTVARVKFHVWYKLSEVFIDIITIALLNNCSLINIVNADLKKIETSSNSHTIIINNGKTNTTETSGCINGVKLSHIIHAKMLECGISVSTAWLYFNRNFL